MTYFDTQQLAACTGLAVRSIRHHVKSGWLKEEPKTPGVRGKRFTRSNAQKWIERFYPSKKLPV
jgi:hypothetical protein